MLGNPVSHDLLDGSYCCSWISDLFYGTSGRCRANYKSNDAGTFGIDCDLAANSITLDGGMEGLKFYLVPDWSRVKEVGLMNVIIAAMNQSFFTLSLGIGSMAIFGSYMGKDRSLTGESVRIAILDTFVAITSGLIIFPACFAFGVDPNAGPELIFITLPNVFNAMSGGRFWGALFFVFMTFAAFSTIVAVFENIIACCMDKWHWSRKKASGQWNYHICSYLFHAYWDTMYGTVFSPGEREVQCWI